MKKIIIVLLSVLSILSFTACGKKNEDVGIDKGKVDAILESGGGYIEDDELLTADERALMESMMEFATFSVYTIYDYPDGMDLTENLKSLKNISTPETFDYNSVIVLGYASKNKEMKVKSVNFYDIDIYEEEDMKDFLGMVGEVEAVVDGEVIRTQITVVLNLSNSDKITFEYILS